MSLALAAVGPSAYWYLARGTGAVSLVLLTASVVLGVMDSLRFAAAPRWPRFAIDSLHRDLSLLVIALLVLHIVVSVLDSFAPIGLVDSVIPFIGTYRPLWLGLGVLSFDLLLALAITSLVRRRLGYRAWRAIHWLAYASWPVAVLHGLGTGSDSKVWWMLALTAACVAAVVIAMLTRIARSQPGLGSERGLAVALTLATALGIAIFTLAGPLQRGWARRAGTPASILGLAGGTASRSTAGVVSVGGSASRAPRGTVARQLKAPFQAQVNGTITQTQEPGGAIIDIALRLSGGVRGRLRVRLAGSPINGGGLSLTGSQVDLLAAGLPSVMQGRIVSLQGQQFVARVAGGSGSSLDLHANLTINGANGAVTGTLSATSGGRTG